MSSPRPLIAFDIGGSKIAAASFSGGARSLRLRKKLQEPTAQTCRAVVEQILALTKQLTPAHPAAVGIALAALLDRSNRVVQAPNLPFLDGVRLGKLVRAQLHCPVNVENDANAFTLAEARFGAGKGKSRVVGITLGTGVGGGFVVDGKIYRGGGGTAGEIGHLQVSDRAVAESTGRRGTIEALTSGRSIERSYEIKSRRWLSALEIEQLALRGNSWAQAAYQQFSLGLAAALDAAFLLYDPDCIVLGGSLSRAQSYIRLAIAQARQHAMTPHHRRVPIGAGRLKDKATLYGAALVASLPTRAYLW